MRFRRMSALAWVAALACALLAAAVLAHDDWKVPEEAKKMKNPVAQTSANLAAAKEVFLDKCAKCHGDEGKGDGPDAMMYSPAPADLSDAKMMGMMTDGEIFYKITEGRKPMPSFKKDFSDEERWQLVNFVRSLAPKPAPVEKPASKPATKKPPTKKP